MSLNNYLNIKKDILDELENNEFKVEFKEIQFNSIVFSAFVQLKCMNCGMFRRNYHCLAIPRWKKAKENLSKYNKFYLLYIKANNKERIEGLKRSNLDRIKEGRKTMNDYIIKRNACNANQVMLYSKMRNFLIKLKYELNDKNILYFGSGGGCRACKVCGLIKPHKLNEKRTPCKKPNKSFNAPESWGIDVYATLKNNNIEFEIIPNLNLINVGMIALNEK